MKLEFFGKMLAFGWGPEVIKGFIPAYLKLISLDKCLEYIRNNTDLLAGVSEKDWATLREVAKAGNIHLSMAEVVNDLQKDRPDVLAIILSHPQGRTWLSRQIEETKKKLTS